MSVFNTEETYLNLAIKSVLEQSYNDFEFIIINDNSNYFISQFLLSWSKRDERIKLFEFNMNVGLTRALNYGLGIAKGQFIARHDSDDISSINRLHIQYNYLVSNPKIDAVGSYTNIINKDGVVADKYQFDFNEIKLKKSNHLIHGSMMFRRKVFDIIGGYDERLLLSQDYGLYLTMLNKYKMTIFVIPEFLYDLRRHSDSISQKRKFSQLYYATFAKFSVKHKFSKPIIYLFTLFDFFFIHYLFLGKYFKPIFNLVFKKKA
jgi:glycosyltransferase involved in cell wall biosynthesis